jgi:hypothetical protein
VARAALVLLLAALAEEPVPKPPPAPPPAARVVAAVARAARENAARPEEERARGDGLGDLLVRAAAAAAGEDGRAFLVGLAHGVDPDATLARHPLTRAAFRDLESPEEAAARREALGAPSLRGRKDLLLHFAASAAVAAVATPEAAEAGGIAKEVADSRPNGSGFSFADLLADLAGVRFAAWVGGEPKARLARLAEGFRGIDFCPDPAGEPEGLSAEAFAKEYGGVADDRFRRKVAALREAVEGLAAYGEGRRTGDADGDGKGSGKGEGGGE